MECKVDLARAMPGEDEDPMITLVVDIYVRTPSDVLVKFVKFGSSIFQIFTRYLVAQGYYQVAQYLLSWYAW